MGVLDIGAVRTTRIRMNVWFNFASSVPTVDSSSRARISPGSSYRVCFPEVLHRSLVTTPCPGL